MAAFGQWSELLHLPRALPTRDHPEHEEDDPVRHEEGRHPWKWSELLHLLCNARNAVMNAKLAPSGVKTVTTCAENALGTAKLTRTDAKLATTCMINGPGAVRVAPIEVRIDPNAVWNALARRGRPRYLGHPEQ